MGTRAPLRDRTRHSVVSVTLTPLLESRAVTPRAHPSAITRASTANIQRCVIADDVVGPGRPRARGNDERRAQNARLGARRSVSAAVARAVFDVVSQV